MANLAELGTHPDEASEKFASFQTDLDFQSDLEIGLSDALATSSPSAYSRYLGSPRHNSPFLAGYEVEIAFEFSKLVCQHESVKRCL